LVAVVGVIRSSSATASRAHPVLGWPCILCFVAASEEFTLLLVVGKGCCYCTEASAGPQQAVTGGCFVGAGGRCVFDAQTFAHPNSTQSGRMMKYR
jgi:hypothetical protein